MPTLRRGGKEDRALSIPSLPLPDEKQSEEGGAQKLGNIHTCTPDPGIICTSDQRRAPRAMSQLFLGNTLPKSRTPSPFLMGTPGE